MKILVQDKTVIINSERYCAIGTENNNVVALVEGSEKREEVAYLVNMHHPFVLKKL